MPCMKKRFTTTNRRRYTGQLPGTKSARVRDQPLMNRGSIAHFVPPFVFPDMPCMKRAYKDKRRRSTGQQPGRKSARGPADKPRINRLSTGGFVSAFGLNMIFLVRAYRETFRRRFLDALEGTKDHCFLGKQFRWHPILPNSTRPPHPDPTRPWYVRVLDSTG